MDSAFREQIVKKKPGWRDWAIRAGLILGVAVIFAVTFLFIPFVWVLISVAAMFGAYYLSTQLNVEYEYSVVADDLTIDAIYNRGRRKNKLRCAIGDIELMARPLDPNHISVLSTVPLWKDFSSGDSPDGLYAFIFSLKGQRLLVHFEPNDAILTGIESHIPRGRLYRS